MKEFPEHLLPPHGGYRDLKTFQISRLVYDLTVIFVDKYIRKGSRTVDQMEQAARSGVQNIAEGSEAAAVSKLSEITLTNVAKASLEELKLDYEDYLRHKHLPMWQGNHSSLLRFKKIRCSTIEGFREWIRQERLLWLSQNSASKKGNTVPVSESPCLSVSQSNTIPRHNILAANGILSLLNIVIYLLKRQVDKLARGFEQEGGFKERAYRVRKQHRGY